MTQKSEHFQVNQPVHKTGLPFEEINILLGSKLNQGTSQIMTFYIGKGLRINFTFETFMALL